MMLSPPFSLAGIKLTEGDQDLYKNFPLVISERWQAEVSDTVFDTINHDYDKVEHKKRAKAKKATNFLALSRFVCWTLS